MRDLGYTFWVAVSQKGRFVLFIASYEAATSYGHWEIFMKETTNYMKLTVIKTFKRTRKRKNVLVSSNNRDKTMKVEEYRKCSEKINYIN